MIIRNTITVHPTDPTCEVLPHFRDNMLHLTALETQWDKAAEVINEWVDENPEVRMTFLNSRVGEIIALLYALKLSQPRPEYNIIKWRGVTMYDGEPAAMYKLLMPGKGLFQDTHIDPSWLGLLSLTSRIYEGLMFFDMLDHIWCLREREEIPVELDFTQDYYRGLTHSLTFRDKDEFIKYKPGDQIDFDGLKSLRLSIEPTNDSESELCWLAGRTPATERVGRWWSLIDTVLTEEKSTILTDAMAIWYGKDKFDELKTLAKKVKFDLR